VSFKASEEKNPETPTQLDIPHMRPMLRTEIPITTLYGK
jgi:hypothetical protein